jgi:hypothetical protein
MNRRRMVRIKATDNKPTSFMATLMGSVPRHSRWNMTLALGAMSMVYSLRDSFTKAIQKMI